jgi:hypothetical protein
MYAARLHGLLNPCASFELSGKNPVPLGQAGFWPALRGL